MKNVNYKKETDNHVNLVLVPGHRVKTKWGWFANITEVTEWQFQYGHGVTVIREDDGVTFSLSPSDFS